MNKRSRITLISAWALTIIVVALALYTWGSTMLSLVTPVTVYTLFPLLGLLAFSIMWAHYAASVARQTLGVDKAVLKKYVEITSLAVLALILLHPGLISWELWKEGYGLPPFSELKFVDESLKGAVILGVIGWVLFLAYELRRWFSDRRWWRWVELATDAAMIMIFIHALRLGSHLQSGWYRGVWIFYGVSLVGFLCYIYARKFRKK